MGQILSSQASATAPTALMSLFDAPYFCAGTSSPQLELEVAQAPGAAGTMDIIVVAEASNATILTPNIQVDWCGLAAALTQQVALWVKSGGQEHD